MFEKYIDKYYFLVSQEFEGEDQVELNKVFTNDSIPTPLKKYFESEVENSLNFTRSYIQDSRIFSLAEQDVDKSLAKLESSLRESMKIDSLSFEDFLKNAIEIRFNYILRPKFTISNLAFNESDEIETEYLKNIFDYFIEYKYLKEGFLNYLEANPSILISKTDFDEAIKQIDASYIYELSSDEFIEMANSCFDLFTFDGLTLENTSIPIESLMVFFDEKGVFPILDKLQELVNQDDIEFINKEKFQEMISEMSSENTDNIEDDKNDDIVSEDEEESNDNDLNENQPQEENITDSDLNSIEDDLDTLSSDIETEIDTTDVSENINEENDFDFEKELSEISGDDINIDAESAEKENEAEVNKNQESRENEEVENLEDDIKKIDNIFPGEDNEIKYQEIDEDSDEFQSEIEKLYKDI